MESTKKTLVILDRDGVINHDSADYIKSPEEWKAIQGSLSAIARLSQAGHLVAIATNQSGLARGLFSSSALSAIHEKMRSSIQTAGGSVDAIVYCPHGPDDNCSCRKPRPGLLHQIIKSYDQATLGSIYVVGDSIRDLQAAIAIEAKPILVETGKGQKTKTQLRQYGLSHTPVYSNLKSFTDALLDQEF